MIFGLLLFFPEEVLGREKESECIWKYFYVTKSSQKLLALTIDEC